MIAGASPLYRLIKGDSLSILVSKSLAVPHECLLSTLKLIDRWYRYKWLPRSDFDLWTSLNSKDYQLGDSEACMRLWSSVRDAGANRGNAAKLSSLSLPEHNSVVWLIKCPTHKGGYLNIKWKLIKKKEDLDVIDLFWKWSSAADKSKTNVSASDMIWHIRNKPWAVAMFDKWKHLFSVGLYNVTVCALLMHLVGNPNAHKVFELLSSYKFCCMSIVEYKSVLKDLSVALRRTSHWPDGTPASLEEVTGCASWDLAIGRSLNLSDWEEERRNRVLVKLPLGSPILQKRDDASNAKYCDELRLAVDRLMYQLVPPCKREVSWPQYVEDRQSWCSSGSTGGKRAKLNDGSAVRLNKHAYFETLQKEEMIAWLDSEPIMEATASEKFEMGKARAIYGTQPKDYSITSFSLDGIETVMNRIDGIESGLLGLDQIATMIRRCKIVNDPETEGSMIDYADFNRQHTLQAQYVVFESLAAALELGGYHRDKVRAAKWVAQSLLNQWCKFPLIGKGHERVVQGMFSGGRATNFLNTILNLAYFILAKQWVAQQLDISPIQLHNIHQGDDVWITNKSRIWAIAVWEVMCNTGFEFQASKQMFSVSRGEFLRVVYTEQGCRGYLGRAIATLVMKPIQNTDVLAPHERAVAINDQIMILRRRGMTDEGSELIWNAITPYSARSRLASGYLTLPVPYLLKRKRDNGLDLGPPGTAAEPSEAVAEIPTMRLSSKALEASLANNMATDWAKTLSNSLKTEILFDKLVETLHKTNVVDSLRQEDRILALKSWEIAARTWLAKLKCGKVTRNRAVYAKLLDGPTADVAFERFLTTLCDNKLPKNSMRRLNPIESIHRGVGASPFKGLDNTMTASGLPIIPAAELALKTNTNPIARDQGLSNLSAIRQACGDDILRALLREMRSSTSPYTCDLHPNVISWLHSEALNTALSIAINTHIKDIADFKDLLDEQVRAHVRSAIAQPILPMISRY